VCCSVLQCVAVCCSATQCVAVCCSVLQCVAVCCSVLQCDFVCCSVLQCVLQYKAILKKGLGSGNYNMFLLFTHKNQPCLTYEWVISHTYKVTRMKESCRTSRTCNMLQRVAACCSVLQCVAVCCSVLQYVAVYHVSYEWVTSYIAQLENALRQGLSKFASASASGGDMTQSGLAAMVRAGMTHTHTHTHIHIHTHTHIQTHSHTYTHANDTQ